MTKDQIKLKDKRKIATALIEQGREVEQMNTTPGIEHLEVTFNNLKFAIQQKDMVDQRLFGRRLAAQVTKFMVEKL